MWKNIVFFHVCWYSQSAADTSLAFGATRATRATRAIFPFFQEKFYIYANSFIILYFSGSEISILYNGNNYFVFKIKTASTAFLVYNDPNIMTLDVMNKLWWRNHSRYLIKFYNFAIKQNRLAETFYKISLFDDTF